MTEPQQEPQKSSGVTREVPMTSPAASYFSRGTARLITRRSRLLGTRTLNLTTRVRAGNATLVAGLPTRPIGADTNGFIFFTGTSTAENATITVNQFAELSFAPGFFGGGTATAGNANITNNGNTNFYQGSSAGSATITTNAGGLTRILRRKHRGQRGIHHQCGRRR